MTIKECIDIVENLKPNQYSLKEKVMWLSFIDEIIINDVLKTHEGYDGKYDNFAGYSEDKLSVQLIVASPYDRLYTAYLKMKIDGENGETARYNNSASLFNSYLMEFRKHYNKTHMPLDMTSNKPMPKQCNSASISDAMFESLKRELYYLLSEDFAEMTSRDKLYDIVTSYAINNVQMLKGKDGRDGIDGKDGVDGKDGKDGRDGINGRNGKDGTNGEDYILTDADKDEIVAQVVESLESTNPSSTVEYYTQDTEGFWNVGYIRTGGTFNTSHASYKCTNLLPINEYTVEEIDILGRGTSGSVLSVAYYKDDETFISGQVGDRITSVEIPYGTYYMAFTIIVDVPTANNVLKLKRTILTDNGLDARVSANEEAIGEVEQRLSAAEQTISDLQSTDGLELKVDGGLTRIFRTIGVIGDSLSSGEMTHKDANGNRKNFDMYEYSWLQYMARNCGSTGYNFSRGGLSTRTFLQDVDGKATDCYANPDHKCQAYFIALGHNDYNQGIGIGTVADINFTDYTKNADTYCGNYAKIIQRLQAEVSPYVKIFVITMKKDGWDTYEQYNAAIKKIAPLFNNVYLIDINEFFPDVPDEHYTHGHGNTMGYYQYSLEIQTIVDKIIRDNPEEFRYVQFINKFDDDGNSYEYCAPDVT